MDNFICFDRVKQKIINNDFVTYKLNNLFDNYKILTFKDKTNTIYNSVVRYDSNNNEIFPPEAPTVSCLKGHIHEYGPDLSRLSQDYVYIGRNFYMGGWRLAKSKWFNPYSVKQYGRDGALEKYREYILNSPMLLNSLYELSGKILLCWCHPDGFASSKTCKIRENFTISKIQCHGDILIELYKTFIKCENV